MGWHALVTPPFYTKRVDANLKVAVLLASPGPVTLPTYEQVSSVQTGGTLSTSDSTNGSWPIFPECSTKVVAANVTVSVRIAKASSGWSV